MALDQLAQISLSRLHQFRYSVNAEEPGHVQAGREVDRMCQDGLKPVRIGYDDRRPTGVKHPNGNTAVSLIEFGTNFVVAALV